MGDCWSQKRQCFSETSSEKTAWRLGSGGGDSFGVGREKLEEALDSGLGTSAEIHGVEASSKVLHTLGVGCTGENSGCCCPVTVTLFVFWATS